MPLDNVLNMLSQRGLTLEVSPDGKGVLRGPKSEITEAVREAVAAYRDEIIERFRPKCTRRIVLLSDRGEVERILESYTPTGNEDHERTRKHADRNPGSTVCCEHLRQRRHAPDEWVRFLTICRPARGLGAAPVGDADGRLGSLPARKPGDEIRHANPSAA